MSATRRPAGQLCAAMVVAVKRLCVRGRRKEGLRLCTTFLMAGNMLFYYITLSFFGFFLFCFPFNLLLMI